MFSTQRNFIPLGSEDRRFLVSPADDEQARTRWNAFPLILRDSLPRILARPLTHKVDDITRRTTARRLLLLLQLVARRGAI